VKSFERLSSGLRINNASDDPAGLAVAESLKANNRVLTQGVRNLNDGISLVNVADAALESLSNIVTRINELATQAATGSYGSAQREAMDQEAQELSEEYSRIVLSTKFNDRRVFSGDFGSLNLQAGYGVSGVIASTLGGAVGTGTFAASSTTTASWNGTTNAITFGDLNSDGILDMVTADDKGAEGWVNIRIGNGDGSFKSPTSFLTDPGTGVSAVVLSDLNNDGSLDIISGGENAIYIQIGNGNGTFASPVLIAEMISASGLAVNDINNDGRADIVATGGSGIARVYLGNGNGTFSTAGTYAAESISHAASLADLNNDGNLDLITVGESGNSGYASIRLGNGDGTFKAKVSYEMLAGTAAVGLYDVSLADLNGDGVLDLVSAGTNDEGAGEGYVSIRLGNADGTFKKNTPYRVDDSYLGGSNSSSKSVELADVNGDGFVDIVTADTLFDSFGAGFTIMLGNGDGTFKQGTGYDQSGTGAYGLAVADLNRDGVPDVATVGTTGGWNGLTTIRMSNTTSGLGPLLPFSLKTISGAKQAMSDMEESLMRLGIQRGVVGAFSSRLSFAVNNIRLSTENLSAAESRIRDVDVAEEVTNLTNRQIQSQAATAILTQANQQIRLVIHLLQ
ncbi:MAG: hypothetical protein GYA55_03535, partial [SAR324 cluster bacterium]|nr:hypothetical protein [SAR324 cluster bacterium]